MEVKTGLAHPECYARDLANCSREMSREHPVTEKVLQAIDGGDKAIEVGGLPWQPNGMSQKIATAALTGRVLCTSHNNALGHLDAAAVNFVRILDHIDGAFDNGSDDEFEIDGDEIERWMLKCLCGLLASKNAVNQRGERIPDWKPPRHSVDILFKDTRFPEGHGMRVANIGESIRRQLLRMQPLWAPDERTSAGIRMWLFEVELILVMDDSVGFAAERLLDNANCRPGSIVYFDPGCTKRLTFRWNEERRGDEFPIRRVPRSI